VLRHSDWGEADRLLTLYSREQGKLRAVAKGVRRMHSRKAGHLEPFTRVVIMLAHGRDLWIVTQAESLDAYQPLRENLFLTGTASYVIELVDRFSYEEGENSQIYRLLTDTLSRLSSGEDPFLVVRYYELHLLDLLGFRPELTHCVNCRAEIKAQDQFFLAEQGGVLCPGCGPGKPEVKPVSMLALKFLRHVQRSTFEHVRRAHIPPTVQSEMEALLQYYLTYLLERGLNSPIFLREVARKNYSVQ